MNRDMTLEMTHKGGYSLVEVLVVIVVTTVGFLALMNLQVGTVKGIGNAKSMIEAVNLAEHFIETLKSEAVIWQKDSVELSNATRFPHLWPAAGVTTTTNWLNAFDPPGTDKRVGPLGFNENWDRGVGLEVPWTVNRKYCVHYRLAWIVENYLLRADVRVSWMREDADVSLHLSCEDGMERDFSNVSSVTVPGMIMRNVFSRAE